MTLTLFKPTADELKQFSGKAHHVTVPFAVKADSIDPAAHTFRGLASTWAKDLGNDVIHQGAFTEWLALFLANKATESVPLCDTHDVWSIFSAFGKLEEATETAEGLDCLFSLLVEDDVADRAFRRLAQGVVRKMSIGYYAQEWSWEQPEGTDSWYDRIRHLYKASVREVSLVLFPMNPGATVDLESVKGFLASLDGRTLDGAQVAQAKALRDALDRMLNNTGQPAPEAAKGLAVDDPQRLALEHAARDLTVRAFRTGTLTRRP